MRSWIRYSTVVATAVAACQFAPRAGSGDDGLPIDALAAADAGPCEAIGVACASDGTLRTCAAVNQAPIDTACAWGCLGSDATAHCGVFVPSGGAATTLDLGSNAQLDDITITGNGDLDGDDGTFGNLRTSSDASTPYKNGVFWQLRGNIAVFKVKSLNISANLHVLGGHAIVIIATNSITINAALDLHPTCAGNNNGFNGGPGGFMGADGTKNAMGSGGGRGGGTDGKLGGGGGGNGAAGGNGGAAGGTPAAGGPAFGDATITLLVGGGGGGGGGKGTGAPKGGGGGGAIQFVTNGTITIAVGGSINAGGCSGGNGNSGEGGGGGGAGGTILLEAHDLSIAGQLAVNGGGGGPGDNGPDGLDALLTRDPAPGGHSADDPNADGGSGAAAAVFAGSVGGNGASTGGGGGGAVGRMRFNSHSGVVSPVDNTKLSPALTDPGSTTTQGKPRID